MDGRKKGVGRKRKEEEVISSSVTMSVDDSEVIICIRNIWQIPTLLKVLENKFKKDTKIPTYC